VLLEADRLEILIRDSDGVSYELEITEVEIDRGNEIGPGNEIDPGKGA
jgi:hypothetical protein